MISVSDDVRCEFCDDPATVDLLDTVTNKRHLYCKTHKPNLSAGERNPRLAIQRYRLPPENPCSSLMNADLNSSEHQSFQREMCQSRILGPQGAVQYYLSRLTNVDQFSLWSDQFIASVQKYISDETDGTAKFFVFNYETVELMEPFLKYSFGKKLSHNYRPSKIELAVVLLLNHPTWSDEQIAERISTTVTQLLRNTNYKALRLPRYHRA